MTDARTAARRMGAAIVVTLGAGSAARAAQPFSCGSFAMLGGAQLLCSHVDPAAPPLICSFSWTLMGQVGQTVVTGSFMLVPGRTNATVYQGSGFSYELSSPIVMCQGHKAEG